MWTISKQTRYALRVVYSLARTHGSGLKLLSELAREEGIPLFFLQKILVALRRDGIISSKAGPRGGYQLHQPPDRITLATVIRSVEGSLAPLPCVGENGAQTCDTCADRLTCGTQILMSRVHAAAERILDQTTFADIVCGCANSALVGCTHRNGTAGSATYSRGS